MIDTRPNGWSLPRRPPDPSRPDPTRAGGVVDDMSCRLFPTAQDTSSDTSPPRRIGGPRPIHGARPRHPPARNDRDKTGHLT
ncbi:hypothetical protein GCM10009634_74730 [Saccharothrix xinjiangensis]